MATYNYVIQDARIGMQQIETVETSQKHPLGTIVRASDPTYGAAEFIYVKGFAQGGTGKWVAINTDDGTSSGVVANGVNNLIGIAMGALDATTKYGWVMIEGKHPAAKCLTGYADNGRVFLTSTTGSVDDTSVAGDMVWNAKGASSTTANTFVAEFELHRPFTTDKTANT
jgi:hypothetical protein